MAVEKNQNSLKKKKIKSKGTEEEIVIKIGEEKKEESLDTMKEEELELDEELDKELEEEIEGIEAEEEEVVVISIGKPPEEEEIVSEEEEVEKIEEEEPVEAEVVEEEEKPPPEEEEATKRKKFAALIVAFILIGAATIASIGVYLLFFQNQDPIAKISLIPDTATAGQMILVDGSNSSDDKGITEYTFYFLGDGTVYSERTNNAPDGEFDGKTTHFYKNEGDYTIELTVMDEDGRANTASTSIAITELEVTIPVEKIGDNCTYEVWGSVEVENNDGLWSGSAGDLGSFTLKKIHIDYEGEMVNSIEPTIRKQDGFGEYHETLEKYMHEDVDLSGTVSGTAYPASGGKIDVDNLQIQQGELSIGQKAYVDLSTNKTIFSFTKSDLNIQASSDIGMTSNDKLWSYSNLREKPAVFRVEELSPDRTFRVGDSKTKILSGVAYHWEVKNATYIKGYPALRIEVDIDDDTMNENGIEEFEMRFWVTNRVPNPIKTYIYTKIFQDGTTTSIYFNNEILDDGFIRGNLPIEYGSCPANTPTGHYHQRNPVGEFLPWESDDYIPDKGSNSSSFEFFPQDAINFANSPGSGLDNYLDNNPSAYVTDGYYNETGDNPLWNLTFGELGDDIGYYIVVEYDGGSLYLIDEDTIELPELRNSTSDFNPILSFSASEQVFRSDNKINNNAFAGGEVWFKGGINYGARANIIYPSISITVSITIERAEYGYYLADEDGTFYAAVDGINGQLIYVLDHEGDNVLEAILGP